jgi:hypothetical protein
VSKGKGDHVGMYCTAAYLVSRQVQEGNRESNSGKQAIEVRRI